jgi:hypothetical protein
MTPQERETAHWKARLNITDQHGTWTAGEVGKKQSIEYCGLGGGKPKQCHKTKREARDHLISLINGSEKRGILSVYRCDWADHYHVGKR